VIRLGAIVGATAVGKTELAVGLAPRLHAEIVSVDSMQIYEGMDAGTAKPDASQRAATPHHMLDIARPGDDVTVADFQERARAAIAGVASRGNLPLLVGGSGLYFRAVVDPLEFPPREPGLRADLEAQAEEVGPDELHRRLTEVDPVAAAKIEPTNVRRIVRALEVIELTGRPFSEAEAWERYESIYDLRAIGLTLPRDVLYERIAERARAMIDAGLIDEARRLAAAGMTRSARNALGYRQVLEAADDGDAGVLVDEIVRATKRFARRQESWFRADPRITWLDASDPEIKEKAAAILG
jgi:tRNA dimethylallyltransferase